MFIAGAGLATLGFGFALVFLLQGTGVERGPHRTVPPWIDLVIGLLLLGSAIYVWFRPPRGPKAAKQRREVGLLGLLAIGLVMYTPSPLYLAALHAIAKAHDGVLVTILSVVLVAVVYMLAIEIPVVAHAIWPEPTIRVVTGVNAWLGRHGRTIVVLAAGAFGVVPRDLRDRAPRRGPALIDLRRRFRASRRPQQRKPARPPGRIIRRGSGGRTSAP